MDWLAASVSSPPYTALNLYYLFCTMLGALFLKMRATYASGEELTWRRRDGGGDDNRDDARTNDGLTGIEHARTAQGRLGLPRTARSDSLKFGGWQFRHLRRVGGFEVAPLRRARFRVVRSFSLFRYMETRLTTRGARQHDA